MSLTDPLDAQGAAGATIRGGASRAGAWTAGAVLSLISIPLLVRHLGVTRFGQYVAVLSLINIAALASDLGIGALGLREWSTRDAHERGGVMGALLGIRILVATAGAVAAIVFAVAAGYSDAMVAGTAIAAVGLFAQVFGDFALVAMAGSLRFGRVATVELARSAFSTAGIVVLVLAGSGLVPFFAAYALAAVAAALLALSFSRGQVSLVPRLRARDWRPLLADSIAYVAASVLYVFYFRVVMLVVSVQASGRQTGLFATAFRVLEFAAAVAAVLAATVVPVLARAERDDGDRLRRGALAVTRSGIVVGTLGALVLGLGAPTVMNLIGGRTDDAVEVLRIMSPAVATVFISFCAGAVLLVMRRYRALLLVNVLGFTVALVGALVLVPDHAARGGAAAAVAGEVLITAGQLYALGFGVRLLRPLAVAALMAAAAIGAYELVPLPNAAATALAAIVFAALAVVLRQVPPELQAAFRDRRVGYHRSAGTNAT